MIMKEGLLLILELFATEKLNLKRFLKIFPSLADIMLQPDIMSGLKKKKTLALRY
jgi:hypothetical protein